MASSLRTAALAATLLWASAGGAVELNAANQAELEQVKGVGPQLSDRLLAERARGPFRDWADLIRRMKGVGPASAAKLSAAGLTVGGAAYEAAPATGAAASAVAVAPRTAPVPAPASEPAATPVKR